MQRLIDLYIRGIDFCIKHDYPTLDFIRENFKGKCEPYGVWVDERVYLRNVDRLVLEGDCTGEIEYDGFSVSRLFLRHNSTIKVKASQYAIVTIESFDSSHLDLVVAGSKARVCVVLYGDSTVNATGNVQIVKKNKKTY